MVKFLLEISGGNDNDSEYCSLIREFEMPNLPRVGEIIVLAGEEYEVRGVYHQLEDVIVLVWIEDLSLNQLVTAFIKYDETWKLQGFSEADRKEFYRLVEKQKKRREIQESN